MHERTDFTSTDFHNVKICNTVRVMVTVRVIVRILVRVMKNIFAGKFVLHFKFQVAVGMFWAKY